MKMLSAILCIAFVTGCDSRASMREEFNDGSVVVMTDSAGNKYAVTHNFGDNYTVEPVK